MSELNLLASPILENLTWVRAVILSMMSISAIGLLWRFLPKGLRNHIKSMIGLD